MILSTLKHKVRNPRKISAAEKAKLAKSIAEFPKMLTLRPIVYDPVTMEVLGGNQRLTELIEAGYKEAPDGWFKSAADLTEEEKRRFVVQDNVQAGDWDTELLLADYEVAELEEWGLDLPEFNATELEMPNELTADAEEKPPKMQITFKTVEQLQKAEIDILELLDRKYPGAYYSVSAGGI